MQVSVHLNLESRSCTCTPSLLKNSTCASGGGLLLVTLMREAMSLSWKRTSPNKALQRTRYAWPLSLDVRWH